MIIIEKESTLGNLILRFFCDSLAFVCYAESKILTHTRSAVVGFVGVNEFGNPVRRIMMKTKLVTIVAILILAALPVSVALADAKGPNVRGIPRASCSDGSTFYLGVVPGIGSFVAQDPASTRVAVVMNVSLFAPDGTLVQIIFDKPGNQPTVWCEWTDPDITEGFYLGGDVVLTPVNP